jgi:hypothetical protein
MNQPQEQYTNPSRRNVSLASYLHRLAGAVELLEYILAAAELHASLLPGLGGAPDLAQAIARLRLALIHAVRDFGVALGPYLEGER